MKKIFFSALSLALLFASCSNDDDATSSSNEKDATKAIKFTTNIIKSKITTDNTWDAGDQIGIVMKKTGKIMTYSSVFNYSVYPISVYKTNSGDGVFTSISDAQALYFPESGEAVDIVAFYPKGTESGKVSVSWLPGIDSTTYNTVPDMGIYQMRVDLSDQSSQADLDVLYSNNLKNRNIDRTDSQLSFVHEMNKTVFNITAGEGVTDADLAGMEVRFFGPSTFGIFNLTFGRFDNLSHPTISGRPFVFEIKMKTRADGKFAEATLFPEVVPAITQVLNGTQTAQATRVEFKLKNGDVFTLPFTKGITIEGNTHVTRDIMLKKSKSNIVVDVNGATITDWVTEHKTGEVAESN